MPEITAIILAAGLSQRMGSPKALLPWGNHPIIAHIVEVLVVGGIADILVVTGRSHVQVETALRNFPVKLVYNPDYERGEMLSSIHAGLRLLSEEAGAALVCLGDQPQVLPEVVRAVAGAYRSAAAPLVVPSYHNHRGHPWLAARTLWPEILALTPPATLRTFLNDHAGLIQYVDVDTPSVLADIDTPGDYKRQAPRI